MGSPRRISALLLASTGRLPEARGAVRGLGGGRLWGGGLLHRLELKNNGSFAWIETHTTVEVWALDALGRRMLDGDADIEPDSLRLENSTLSWRNGGLERSAMLE
jgi:hypothetical protein